MKESKNIRISRNEPIVRQSNSGPEIYFADPLKHETWFAFPIKNKTNYRRDVQKLIDYAEDNTVAMKQSFARHGGSKEQWRKSPEYFYLKESLAGNLPNQDEVFRIDFPENDLGMNQFFERVARVKAENPNLDDVIKRAAAGDKSASDDLYKYYHYEGCRDLISAYKKSGMEIHAFAKQLPPASLLTFVLSRCFKMGFVQ